MSEVLDPLERLCALFARLPGVGQKSAMRMALAVTKMDADYAQALAAALVEARTQLRLCSVCADLTGSELCERCSDARRDRSVVCVVAQPQDRMALDRTGVYRGLYHVLHGVIDPLAGVGPNDLKIRELIARLERRGEDAIEEVIVATSPNVEGDATALYLARVIAHPDVRVSRIASGVAVGGELEYADVTTLHRAIEDRRSL